MEGEYLISFQFDLAISEHKNEVIVSCGTYSGTLKFGNTYVENLGRIIILLGLNKETGYYSSHAYHAGDFHGIFWNLFFDKEDNLNAYFEFGGVQDIFGAHFESEFATAYLVKFTSDLISNIPHDQPKSEIEYLLYPNPSKPGENIRVYFPDLSEAHSIMHSIYNAEGKLLFISSGHIVDHMLTVPLGDFTPGNYLLSFQIQEKTTYVPILIQ